jgi:hypothetical protein
VSIDGAYPYDILWRPGSLELLINIRYQGKDEDSLFIYNVNTKESTALKLSERMINSLSFDENGLLYYLEKAAITEDLTVNTYDIDTQVKTQYPSNIHPNQVEVRGKFVALRNPEHWYLYFTN